VDHRSAVPAWLDGAEGTALSIALFDGIGGTSMT
jgi:hypothetical protein